MLEHLFAAIAAIVALLATLITLAACKLMLDFSRALAEASLRHLELNEKEAGRSMAMAEMSRTIEKLDVTVGGVFQQMMKGNRTVLESPLQHGQAPPGSPGIRRPWTPEDKGKLPPEGLVDGESTPAQSVGEQVRARAFGEPT